MYMHTYICYIYMYTIVPWQVWNSWLHVHRLTILCVVYVLYICRVPYSGENLADTNFGRLTWKSYHWFLNLADLPENIQSWPFFAAVSGTEKCLAALAGPFSVTYFPIFALPSIRAIISVGTLSSTALTLLPHRIFVRHQSLLHAFIHLLYFFLQKSATLMHSSFLM